MNYFILYKLSEATHIAKFNRVSVREEGKWREAFKTLGIIYNVGLGLK